MHDPAPYSSRQMYAYCTVVCVFEYFEYLIINFTNNSIFAYDAWQTYFDKDVDDKMPRKAKLNTIKLVTEAYCLALDKHMKCMERGSQLLVFLKQYCIFNHRRLALISSVKADYTAIPGIYQTKKSNPMKKFTVL